MNDFSPETNQLLGLARGAGGLSETRRAHIKAGVFTQLVAAGLVTQVGLGAAGAGSSAGAGATTVLASKAAWFSSSLAKVVSALALLSAAGGGAYVVTRTERAPAPPSVVAAGALGSPAVSGASASVVAAAPPAAESPWPATSAAPPSAPAGKVTSSSARSTGASSPSVVNAETLAEETRLLRDADQALRSGNSVRALGLLDEHATRFPRGVLAPERSAERWILRCQLGQVDAKSAQAYLKSHPNSAFAARISDACKVVAR